ncbi:MAG: hypothetical protein COW02_03900 [Comamonadaceae bacterium CG12_big_fil_rev_8_21_14_0_65_59_15]|nr:MAG: hypothetical protein COW02_03900 [Comamonadaceae bacterium CG12_big_fil_rev_8_21_14_0_65_59_15]
MAVGLLFQAHSVVTLPTVVLNTAGVMSSPVATRFQLDLSAAAPRLNPLPLWLASVTALVAFRFTQKPSPGLTVLNTS